jgi:restriction system protein
MSKEQMQSSSDLDEFIRMLVTPQPYMIFCDRLRELTPKGFETLIEQLLRQMGLNVLPGGAGPDEAIDLVCEIPGGGIIIVQCKKWKRKVGVPIVREVFGAAIKHQAAGAIIVTVGEFTDPAKEFTIDLRIPLRLIDGKELFELMNQHMPNRVADILKKNHS